MKHQILALAASLSLFGCAALGLTGNPANDIPILAHDGLEVTNAACADYAPFGAAAILAPDPKVQAIAVTIGGMCDLATGQVAAAAVAKVDPSTAAWIGAGKGMLQALGVKPVAAKS